MSNNRWLAIPLLLGALGCKSRESMPPPSAPVAVAPSPPSAMAMPADWPPLPIDGLALPGAATFHEPEGGDPRTPLAVGQIVELRTVAALDKLDGKPGLFLAAGQCQAGNAWVYLPHFKPLAKGGRPSAAAAGKILFRELPPAVRPRCEGYADRILWRWAPAPGAGTLLYSESPDDDCRGYLALVDGTDEQAKVVARARRGPIIRVLVHEAGELPPLIEILESLPTTPTRSGLRDGFFVIQGGQLAELAGFDRALDERRRDGTHSTATTIAVRAAPGGLEVSLRVVQRLLAFTDGKEQSRQERERLFHYDGKALIEKK